MTKARSERNKRIKRQIIRQLDMGLSLKEALYVVSERWYLSAKHLERVYYDTILVDEEPARVAGGEG